MCALTQWNHSKQKEMKRKVLSYGFHYGQQMLSLYVIMVEDSCPETLYREALEEGPVLLGCPPGRYALLHLRDGILTTRRPCHLPSFHC